MSSLTNEQKALLFDYCFGLASETDIQQAEDLIASDKQAAQFVSNLKSILSLLDLVEIEPCPDTLVEQTIHKLKQADQDNKEKLEQLLAAEQAYPKTIKLGIWRNLTQAAAIAAIVLFCVGIVIPALTLARQSHYQYVCQNQLTNIYQGFATYKTDHDGCIPAVTMAAGSPWWKVGYQGKENHSNTRPVWLLVRQGYVEPDHFICPGRSHREKINTQTIAVCDYYDFPAREYVHYSFRICCPNSKKHSTVSRPLFADMNPLCEGLPSDYTHPFKKKLDERLLNSNSENHRNRGQNVMLCNGKVAFRKTRFYSNDEDDIFTLRHMIKGSEMTGCEKPSCESDVFLAP
jgi:DNA-binding protein H-NS